jgi:hypothetical protein
MPLSAEPFEIVVPELVSADSSNGHVVFSLPVTASAGDDSTFSDPDAPADAVWLLQATPSSVLIDSSFPAWSPGDTYESLGGSTRVSPPPGVGSIAVS